jgi:hypothetical protein
MRDGVRALIEAGIPVVGVDEDDSVVVEARRDRAWRELREAGVVEVDEIEVVHEGDCGAGDGGECSCEPRYAAAVHDDRSGRDLRYTFPSRAAAVEWRSAALAALRKGRAAPAAARARLRA